MTFGDKSTFKLVSAERDHVVRVSNTLSPTYCSSSVIRLVIYQSTDAMSCCRYLFKYIIIGDTGMGQDSDPWSVVSTCPVLYMA